MTAHNLARRLHSLPSTPMRRSVLREWLEGRAPGDAVPLLDQLLRRGRRSGPPFDVALLALTALLDDDGGLAYERRAALYVAAREQGREALANLFLSAPAADGPGADTERALRAGGRPLTLGERKALARGPRGETLDRLMRDTNPQVVRALLENPRLTEDDVVRICATRPQNPASLREVFRSARWIARQSVKRALVFNPHMPGEIATRLVPFLDRVELRALARDTAVLERVRRQAESLLDARREAERPG